MEKIQKAYELNEVVEKVREIKDFMSISSFFSSSFFPLLFLLLKSSCFHEFA